MCIVQPQINSIARQETASSPCGTVPVPLLRNARPAGWVNCFSICASAMPRAQNRTVKGSILKEDEILCRSGYIIYLCVQPLESKWSLDTKCSSNETGDNLSDVLNSFSVCPALSVNTLFTLCWLTNLTRKCQQFNYIIIDVFHQHPVTIHYDICKVGGRLYCTVHTVTRNMKREKN